jgi:penicillin-binding protein 1A
VAQQLRRWLITWADKHGYNINADGLVVRTTIDSRLQEMAVDALTRQADKLQKNADAAWGKRMTAPVNKQLVADFVRETAEYKAARDSGLADDAALKKVQANTEFMQALWREKTHLQAAFVAQNPTNGHILAWVGSRDFKHDQFDHVQQARRQPGSTFKPFVYGAAFAQGISPSEMLIDEAVEFRIDEKTVWKPGDVHESSGLPTTLREGLVQSKNTITAQLMQRVGAPRVAEVAYAMGVRQSKLDLVPSLSLGTSPVTLKEMVSAYSTIANSGQYIEPVLVTRIENRKGEVLEDFQARMPEQGLAMPAAQTLLDVMRGVIDKGTGAGIRSRFGLQDDLAGTTGTTQDNTDGWFILMHPELVSGAWVGFNDNRITMGNSWGQGAHNALNIVGDFFQQTQKGKLVNAKAVFTAPRNQGVVDPSLMAKVNDWWSNAFQTPPEAQSEQPAVVTAPQGTVIVTPSHPVVVAEPSPPLPPARPAFSEPTVGSAQPPGFDPALQRTPDFQWRTERPPLAEYPQQRAPRVVVRAPEGVEVEPRQPATELGAGPAQPRQEFRVLQPGDGGIRILREVSPAEAGAR